MVNSTFKSIYNSSNATVDYSTAYKRHYRQGWQIRDAFNLPAHAPAPKQLLFNPKNNNSQTSDEGRNIRGLQTKIGMLEKELKAYQDSNATLKELREENKKLIGRLGGLTKATANSDTIKSLKDEIDKKDLALEMLQYTINKANDKIIRLKTKRSKNTKQEFDIPEEIQEICLDYIKENASTFADIVLKGMGLSSIPVLSMTKDGYKIKYFNDKKSAEASCQPFDKVCASIEEAHVLKKQYNEVIFQRNL